MFETSPTSNFFANRSSWVLVSLNGGQRDTESGRKPDREGSSGHPSSREMLTAVRRSTSAYSSYEPPLISCCVCMNSGISSSRDSVYPSRSASLEKASNAPVSQSIRVP